MYSHDTGLLAHQKWFQAVPSAYIHLHKYSVSPLHLHQQSWSKRSKCKLHLYLFVRTFLSLFFGFNCTFQHIFKLFLHQLWSICPRSNTKCTLCMCKMVNYTFFSMHQSCNRATGKMCVGFFSQWFLIDFSLVFGACAIDLCALRWVKACVKCWWWWCSVDSFIHSFIIRHLEMNTL